MPFRLFSSIGVTVVLAGTLGVFFAAPAYADEGSSSGTGTLDALSSEYRIAVESYQGALDRLAENEEHVSQLQGDIAEAESALARSQDRLGAASVELYKNAVHPGDLFEAFLAAPSLSESISLYDEYVHIQAYRQKQYEAVRQECDDLRGRLSGLEEERDALAQEVDASRQSVADAKNALREASHLDGGKYHQVQQNGVNCGATAFIVGVNTLLGKNKYTDNAKVWASKAFGKDSTRNLVEKGTAWLKGHNLSTKIKFEYVSGDIHKTSELREQLEKGNVVVLSSGSGSEWQRVDGTEPKKGLYPGGHWIMFYGYSEGVYYANDSAVNAKRGAGCPYTEKQMQQWLDGRAYHSACVLSRI